MKKKLILTIALLFVGVFSFSVSAASTYGTINGNVYNINVYASSPVRFENTSWYDSFVSVIVRNTSSSNWCILNLSPTISFNGSSDITQYDVIDAVDCAPSVSSYGVVTLNPSTGRSALVLAPGELFVCSFTVRFYAGNLNPIVNFSIGGTAPSAASYAFDELEDLPANELSYLAQLDERLNTLIDLVTYSGSHPSTINTSYPTQNSSYNYADNNAVGPYIVSNLRLMRPYYTSYDYEYDPTSDSFVEVGTVRYEGIVFFQLYNSSQNQYKGSSYITLQNCMPNNANVVFDELWSKSFDYVQKSSYNLRFYFRNYNYNNGYINSRSLENCYLVFHYDLPLGVAPLLSSSPFSAETFWGNNVSVDNDYYLPSSEYQILRDIYLAFANSDRSDQDQLSSDITSTSNSIHTQEEQYFSSNAQAIQATGLSNYRFDQNQTGGISAVSNDFTAVFNALGGFNSVFIFSLTLSLALQIFRHHPIVFRAKQVDSTPKVGKGDP